MNHAYTSVVLGFLALSSPHFRCSASDVSDGSPVAPPGAPRSIFVSVIGEPGFGKDPFYPRTARFTEQVRKVDDERPVEPIVPDAIILKGISFVAGRKLAIINNYTVAEGEDFSLRVEGKQIKGQCAEIKEKSVVVKVNGATKEIPLRNVLQ